MYFQPLHLNVSLFHSVAIFVCINTWGTKKIHETHYSLSFSVTSLDMTPNIIIFFIRAPEENFLVLPGFG